MLGGERNEAMLIRETGSIVAEELVLIEPKLRSPFDLN